jgi:oxygen-independent coproporphyrinogen-3 oxidase
MIRGLYIHIPFCSTICSYCDFYIIKNQATYLDRYLDFLLKEFDIFQSENKENITIDSIFIGGGTPSLLTPEQLSKIIVKVKECFTLAENTEISMESNPASLSETKLNEYKEISINRISIGVQSFVKRELGLLKRNHSPKLAEKIVATAVNSGIENVNLDLIFSVPGQSLASWSYSLETAIGLGVNHLSAYNLTFEENTPLWKKMQSGKIVKYNDEVDELMYFTAIEILTQNGFDHYEISNFAKQENRCIHNMNTWRSGEYLAFGVSSHGFFNGYRYRNINNLDLYYRYIAQGKLPIVEKYRLSDRDYIEELIILGLRAEGIDKSKIRNRFPGFLNKAATLSKDLIDSEFAGETKSHIFLLSKGYAMCDSITAKYLAIIENG